MQNRFHYLFVLAILLFANSVISQELIEKWAQCYGGSEIELCNDIIQIGGFYYTLAITYSIDGDVSSNHGGADIWLIKTDLSGNMVYEKCFGGSYGDGAYNILKVSDTSLYIVGATKSVDGDISENPYPGSSNFWILKLNIDGDIIWDKIAGGNGLERRRNAIVTKDGGLIQAGLTTSYNGDVSVYYGSYDIWFVKVSRDGEIEWDFTLGSPGMEEGVTIIETSDGGYIVAATTSGVAGGNYDTACNFHGYQGGGFVDAWIVKLDSLRNIEWQQCYGGYYHDDAVDIIELEDGYLVAGNTMSNDGDVYGYHGIPGDNDFGQDYWIFKIDFAGNLIWQKCLGGYDNDFARKIFPLSDGTFMVVGRTTSDDGDVIGYHSGITGISGDIWFTKISSQGELLWQYCFGGDGDERIHYGVIQKSDYNYILAIETDTDPWQCGGPMWSDVRIIELDSNVTSINELTGKENKLVSVYPNPASSYLTFYYSNTFVSNEPMDLQIRNVQGQVIHTSRCNANKGIEIIDVRGWQKGIYFYEWKCENKFGYGKFMIVR